MFTDEPQCNSIVTPRLSIPMNLEVTLGNTKTGTEKARCNTSNTKAEKVQGYEIHSSTKATCISDEHHAMHWNPSFNTALKIKHKWS